MSFIVLSYNILAKLVISASSNELDSTDKYM